MLGQLVVAGGAICDAMEPYFCTANCKHLNAATAGVLASMASLFLGATSKSIDDSNI